MAGDAARKGFTAGSLNNRREETDRYVQLLRQLMQDLDRGAEL